MKTFITLSASLLICLFSVAQTEDQPGKAQFSFEQTEHDFGKLTNDDIVEYTFKFQNTGSEPLIITQALGSCGCTIPEYPLEPIQVGDSGEIHVSFNPKGRSGVQMKTVTITANTNPPATTLLVKSEVAIEE